MKYSIALAVVASLALAGCATSSGKRIQKMENKIDVLQTKVDTVESRQATVETQVGDSRESVGYLKGKVDNAPRGPSTVVVTQGMAPGGDAARTVSKKKLTIRQVQLALKSAGFYDGVVDGKLGKQTKASLKQFQKANGLKADGKVGEKTRTLLSAYVVR